MDRRETGWSESELLCNWQSVLLGIELLWGLWPDFSCY